jgi:transposase
VVIEQLARELEGVKAALAEAMRTIASLEARSASLESALVNTAAERDVLARRLYGPKTERQQTSELQLTLGGLLEEQKRLQRELDALRPKLGEGDADGDGGEGDGARDDDERPRPKPKGRRDLRASSLPVTTVELLDPELERTGRRIGFEEARQLMYVRGGFRVLVRRVAKYEVELHGEPRALCQPSPPSLFPKALAHGSLIAHLAIQKFVLDVPHHRYEQFVMSKRCMNPTWRRLARGGVRGA